MSPRFKSKPISVGDVSEEGGPVYMRDLIAMTGLSKHKIMQEVESGCLKPRNRNKVRNAWLQFPRPEVRRWLIDLGFSLNTNGHSAK